MSQIRHLACRQEAVRIACRFIYNPCITIMFSPTTVYKSTDQADRVLLDFSKAFDRIDHHILIQKMERMAIDPILISWVRNFLTGRKQRVRIGKFLSRFEPVNGGVPQGTVLSPILFMTMTNDLLVDWEDKWKCR